ncbi:MAG: hypothetical protein GC191_05505 [Azospirillum sp.]|nr:hypothetical protein [Azospirillum sp.]
MISLPAVTNFKIATTLDEVGLAADVKPLQPGDARYVDLSPGHGSAAMAKLRRKLETAPAEPGEFRKIVFTGHRGCGKTTELLRIEREFSDRFFPIHLTLDDNLRKDFDYSLMLLSLAHGLAAEFEHADMPLPDAAVEQVGLWFADSTKVDIKRLRGETKVVIGGDAKAGASVLSFGLKLLAQVRNEALGSLERRHEIKSTLQRYARDLIDRVNLLLVEAEIVLRKHGKPAQLLIVQDNLDRLERETARTLYLDTGDLLKQVRAHCVFTAPISLTLAPSVIETVFPHTFTLPMIKVAGKDGKKYTKGLETLGHLVEKRVAAGVFESRKMVMALCRACGGSVRDLMRLVDGAADTAAVTGKAQIDDACVKRSITDLRVSYQRALQPEGRYFPRLAAIHATKSGGSVAETEIDRTKAEDERQLLGELLLNGTVLEYNGDDSWYDVHPVVRELKAFRDALDRRSAAAG